MKNMVENMFLRIPDQWGKKTNIIISKIGKSINLPTRISISPLINLQNFTANDSEIKIYILCDNVLVNTHH